MKKKIEFVKGTRWQYLTILLMALVAFWAVADVFSMVVDYRLGATTNQSVRAAQSQDDGFKADVSLLGATSALVSFEVPRNASFRSYVVSAVDERGWESESYGEAAPVVIEWTKGARTVTISSKVCDRVYGGSPSERHCTQEQVNVINLTEDGEEVMSGYLGGTR